MFLLFVISRINIYPAIVIKDQRQRWISDNYAFLKTVFINRIVPFSVLWQAAAYPAQ